jgi:hypothetical protein
MIDNMEVEKLVGLFMDRSTTKPEVTDDLLFLWFLSGRVLQLERVEIKSITTDLKKTVGQNTNNMNIPRPLIL